MRITTNLPAFALATVVALAGISALPATAAATDPSPTPTPSSDPTTAPSPDPTAAPVVTPAPDPTPAPSAAPLDPTPAPSVDPAPSTAPTPAPVTAPVAAAVAPAPTRAMILAARYRFAARVAIAQRHDRYVSGRTGPNAFDCSGLVRYAYRKAGISYRLGGGHSARGMLTWARMHGLTTRRNPRIGDVAIWGNGRHAGIYIGNGRVISALNPRQGIRITGLHALGDPFTAFIKTH